MKVPYSLAMHVVTWTIPVLMIGIFVADAFTPVGVGVPMLYVIPLVLTLFTPRERDPIGVCALITGLIWVELLFNVPGSLASQNLLNRTVGSMVVWIVTAAVFRYRRVQRELAQAQEDKGRAEQRVQVEVVERAHAEALMLAAQEARAHADTASLGAAAGRREAEEKLHVSEQRLEGIIQSAMDAIITVDESQKIVMFNRAAEEMFGFSSAESMGQPIERFLPARFRGAHRHQIHTFGRSGVTSRKMGKLGTVMGLRSTGEEFPVEAAISHNVVDGKRFYTVILRDIAERKKLEEQLRKTERIAELGTLASGMAHEIGTPMNVILGRAEYLMDRVKDEPTKKGLQTIIAQVERITKVMNQLLSFARRRTPERRPHDLRRTIEDNLEIFQERLRKGRVQVETTLPESCPPVQADGNQMSQVFINLVMNAIHAMPDGGTLRVGLAQEHGMVKLTVADTGHGIPHEALPRIFEPFFTTKEFGKGTGLGLTVVKGIIDEHQGTITVDSEEGKGTTFTISLPKSI